MFENFITFSEVIKLSPNIYYFLREVNYHDKLLALMFIKSNSDTHLENIIDLIKDTKTIHSLISDRCYDKKVRLPLKFLFNLSILYPDLNLDHFLLHRAILQDNIETFKRLIEVKKVNIQSIEKCLLRNAFDNESFEIFKYLIEEHNTDPQYIIGSTCSTDFQNLICSMLTPQM